MLNDQLLDLISRLAKAHESLAESMATLANPQEKKPLGFFVPPSPRAIMVDCKVDEALGALWATFNGKDQPREVLPEGLACKLVGVDLYESESERYGDSLKLWIYVQCENQRYILSSGLRTKSEKHHYNNWAGSMMRSFQNATDGQLQGVLRIFPKQGSKDPMALFASVYAGESGSERIDSLGEPEPETHLEILRRVNNVLGFKNARGPGLVDEASEAPVPEQEAVSVAQPVGSAIDLSPIVEALTAARLSQPERKEWLKAQGFSSPAKIPASEIPRLLAAAKSFLAQREAIHLAQDEAVGKLWEAAEKKGWTDSAFNVLLKDQQFTFAGAGGTPVDSLTAAEKVKSVVELIEDQDVLAEYLELT